MVYHRLEERRCCSNLLRSESATVRVVRLRVVQVSVHCKFDRNTVRLECIVLVIIGERKYRNRISSFKSVTVQILLTVVLVYSQWKDILPDRF